MENKLTEYQKLLNLSYSDAVKSLLIKYGAARDNYVINQESYRKFLNGEIKNFIKSKKISRAESDGLYCHHIEENKYYNLSNPKSIKDQRPPFSAQEKSSIVYCDLIEHAILHVLIYCSSDENMLPDQLLNNIKEWYIENNKPKNEGKDKYLATCYKTAYLSSRDAKELLSNINNKMTIYNI